MVDIEMIGVGFDTSGLTKGTAALKDNANAANKAADAADKTTMAAGKLSTGFGSLKAILATLGVGVLAREFVQVADAMSLLDARLKIATGSSLEFNSAQKEIYRIAQANNVGLQETAKLYTKLADPVKALGGGTREVGAIVDAFATSMRVGGASAQEASSATLQFAQAMGSGKLSGDEFRSMAEASPRFMKALAEGMGVPTGALKEMSTEGKLTADIVGNALIKELSKLKDEAKGLPDTVGGSFTRMKNDIAVAINEINKSSGLTLGVAGIADELGKVIPIIQSDLTGAFQGVHGWVDANRETLGEVWQSSKNILAEVYEIGKFMASVVAFTVDWAVQSGAVKLVVDSIRLLIAGLTDGVMFLGGAFATVGSIILKAVLTPITLVQNGLAAMIEATGNTGLAENLRKSASSLQSFAGAGSKFGDDVLSKFQRGDTAVQKLNASLEKTAKTIKGASYDGYTTGGGSQSYTTLKPLAALAGDTKSSGAIKISEYTRMEEAIKKVTAAQEQELAYGGKLTASAKFQLDEMQKINFALQTKKISQSESIRLIELTTKAVAAMFEVEKQAAAVKSNQANYAQQAEFAQELAMAEIDLSRAREQGQLALSNYSRAIDDENKFLEFEISLIGKSEKERLKAIELYKIEIELKKQLAAINSNRGFDASDRETEAARAEAAAEQARKASGKKIDLTLDLVGFEKTASQLESLSDITGKMGGDFKKATSALSGFANAFKNLAAVEKNHAKGSQEYIQGQIGGYGDMAGAAAGFFEENSEGYELMKAAEQGFRAVQLAMSIAAMIQGKAETASSVADSATKGTASMWAGVAKAFEQLGIFGFIGAGAILAFLGSKFQGGGGGSVGTAGAGNQIDASGRRATQSNELDSEPTNYDPTTGTYTKQNKPQLTDAEVKERADKAAIDAAANALNNLRIEAMKLTAGSEELEQSLARAKIAAGGMGIAHHELATQGMNEAEIASYNYNQALKGQISVQMDIANGTNNTTENMKKLANESQQLAIDLLIASGDIAGARALQRQSDTSGYTKEEVAVYDHNKAIEDQIAALNSGASAAREAEQAEEQLAQTRYELAGRLNILLGRQTQLQFDRATELAATTDEASLAMLNLTYQLEDMYTAIDANYAKLERSIQAEKKLAETRLKGATDLAAALKTTREAITPTLSRDAAKSQLSMYLVMARLGASLPNLAAIKPALDAIARPSMDLFKTFEEYALDQAKTANDINELSDYANKEASDAQRTIDRLDKQLETAKAQIDAIKGVDNSVTSVKDAVKAFEASMLELANAKASAGDYTYTPPVAGGGSSGGGGGYGGGSSSSTAPKFENIEGQGNKDIVAAYREYYLRNPDPSGYKAFEESQLTGDRLMQAILAASAANKDSSDYKMAVSRGYNPDSPTEKFLKSILHPSNANSTTSAPEFAVGTNYVPFDMQAVVHKGERIIPAAENKMLFERLNSPQKTNEALIIEIKMLRDEVSRLKPSIDATAANTGKTMRIMDDLTSESGGDSMKVTVAA